MSVELVAELATAHGGDLTLALDMVVAAANAGAHTVKIQCYTQTHLNPHDPQAAWLAKSCLSPGSVKRIIDECHNMGVEFLATAFDRESLQMLLDLGQRRIKIASSQPVWDVVSLSLGIVKSWAWGKQEDYRPIWTNLTAIPLYPTPLEAVAVAPLLDGWSDHTIGTGVCKHMISRGAQIIEAHFCMPGRSRQMPWDKTPEQFREIRDWADMVETMTSGVSTQFRERWSA